MMKSIYGFVTCTILGTALLVATCNGCAATKTACAVVDLAAGGCAILRYTDDAGVVHAVQMPAEDLRAVMELEELQLREVRDGGSHD